MFLSLLMITGMDSYAVNRSSNGHQRVLKTILSQIEGQPDFRVAGEPIFMQEELFGFYEQREYLPLWTTDDNKGRDQIRELLRYIDSSHSNGLCADDYHLSFFRDLLSHFSIEENNLNRPRLRWSAWYDILLTDALFHYALHLIEGRAPVGTIQDGWNLRKQKVDLMNVVSYTFKNNSLNKVLLDFQPKHKGYLVLQQALQRYREIEALGGWIAIEAGESLRLGIKDERLFLLRTRLLLSGDLISPPQSNSARMEAADVIALKRFQRRYGLNPDGVMGERTLAALNVSVSDRIRQIELNMERWRWLPKTLGEKYLLVNIADFTVSIIDAGKTVMSMPVVVGNRYRKTPVFSARLNYIEFSPYWYVPPTILEEDKLPVIRKDLTYIERNHYEIVAWDRETIIDPQTIDWDEVDAETFPGLLRQKPGPWNALGRVKFMLPNSYSIYLHDTNERHLFGQRNRQFSSGCIRLKRPVDLAHYLLADQGWDTEKVIEAMASKEPKRLYLKTPLPVHVLYWTAWVDDAGQLNFREDAYDRDEDLLQALSLAHSGCRLDKAKIALR
jgi:murein L,D-transpeptidase YcbB/YkuD